MKKTREISGYRFQDLDFNALVEEGAPVIVKAALSQAPLVLAGQSSRQDAISHLIAHAGDSPVINYSAESDTNGRFFYRPEMDGFNFDTELVSIPAFFENLDSSIKTRDGRAFYVCSVDIDQNFSGLLPDNGMDLSSGVFSEYPARAGIWLGSKTTAATHFDVSNNIAACMVGRRRFTLFPPDQVQNLYPGPLEPTPGGQVVSMFDPNAPDFEAFPKAKEALGHAQVAEIEPGDLLVYPAMWWHQVEALDEFNVMINYWWNLVPDHLDDPMVAMLHGMLSLRDRPDYEKKAWRELFDFYVFGDANEPRAHLPAHIHGALGHMDEQTARRLRLQLIKKINR